MDGRGLKRSGLPRIGSRRTHSAKPAELVALVLALHERDGLDERERRRLDREIGAEVDPKRPADRLRLLRLWLGQAPSASLRERARRLTAALSGVAGLLFALGLFFGWAAAAAMLSIEVHPDRVNIVASLGVLVLLPFAVWAIGLLTGLAWAPGRGRSPLPFASVLRRGVLGRWVLWVMPQPIREDLEILIGRMGSVERPYREVGQRLLLFWSQLAGLGFGVGVLLATLAYVVFTDLAFGWSTTLDVGAEAIHRIVQVLAWPWRGLWPAASPSLELVEATRFFRVESAAHIHFVDPIVYGGWWPFLVMSVGGYVVLPRLVSALVCGELLGRATARAMRSTPGVERLVDRLTRPLVDTRAPSEEDSGTPGTWRLVPEQPLGDWLTENVDTDAGEGADAGAKSDAASTAPGPVVIRWADAGSENALRELFERELGSRPVAILEAGGSRSLAQDGDAMSVAAESGAGLVLWVRAYEPPMLEAIDFLAALRARIGPERAIAVGLSEARAGDAETWRRKLATLADPRLVVVDPAPFEATGSEGRTTEGKDDG